MRCSPVLLIARPRLLREMIRHLLEENSAARIVRELPRPPVFFELVEAIEESGAKVVVQAFHGREREAAQGFVRQLAECLPEIAVVSIDLARERLGVSGALSVTSRRFVSIRDVISAVRLSLAGGPGRASVEQFVDSPR